ncbi:inactive tyrosine-protein kinase PEAK1-like isoform X1 [Brienomyrus brachyistius]|uniref:inactive tyrosine-protein kinase PEAK1-like isoform X1 n=1 Tax=Brienomyrus brachyistius TaxID=42636 RepID=UPI0020B211D2|nr:inactive tyrosine-protein kinase PEAK1-like isoform X1 [Brienomyrus brachyistius]
MGSCVSHYNSQVKKEGGLKKTACAPFESIQQPSWEESASRSGNQQSVIKNLIVSNEVDIQSLPPASNAGSPTYTNLGLFRVNMTPMKKPRNNNLTERILGPVDPTSSDSSSRFAPPLLPKKTPAVTMIGLAEKDQGSLKLPSTTSQQGEANLSVVNPLYSTWNANSHDSFESQPLEQEYQNTLELPNLVKGRPANSLSCLISYATPSFEGNKRGARSTESLLTSGRRAEREPVPRPQMQPLFKGMENWEEMSSRIRRLHRDMLRKLAGRCEEQFMGRPGERLHFAMDSWSDFRLTGSKPCCESADAFYYTAAYAKEPEVTYAIKVCRSRGKDGQRQHLHSVAIRQGMAPHFNIQQDCGHFLANLPPRLLPGHEEEGMDGGWNRHTQGHPQDSRMAGSLQSRMVVITPEVPFQTAADFVREEVVRHGQNPELYERQVCLLLLQMCQGLEHAKMHHITHCNLKLENLLLVMCQPRGWGGARQGGGDKDPASTSTCPARLLISNFTQAKVMNQLAEPDIMGDRSRFAPEILAGTQYRKCDEFQAGILIYEMLHLPNPFEKLPELKEMEYSPADLPPLPARSLYSKGLQPLALMLLRANPSERMEMAEARAYLQCLLWGPREDLFQALASNPDPASREAIMQSWLDLKQTLMMIKFAERSLDTAGGVNLEDWLCCQYLAFSTTDSLSHVVRVVQNAQQQQKKHL